METRHRIVFIAAVLIFLDIGSALASKCDEKEPAYTRQSLIGILERGRLSIPIKKQGTFKRAGNIKLDEETCFSLYTYELEFNSGPGTDLHYDARLLVIRNGRYIGMYIVDEPPLLVDGNTVLFLGKEQWGNNIVLDKNGPPKRVLLRGEFRDFIK